LDIIKSADSNTLFYASIISGVVVLLILIFAIAIYSTKKKRNNINDLMESGYKQKKVSHTPETKIFQNVQQEIPEALAEGIPDRLYCFSYNQGINEFNEILQYLFMSTGTSVLARKPYVPINVGDVGVNVGDELFIENHTTDGWCSGFNSTQNTVGLFPLNCTSPRYPALLTLVHIGGGPGEISESIINSCVAFPQHISYRILDRMPTMTFLNSLFVGSSGVTTKCLISGDETFLKDVRATFEQASTEGVEIPLVDEKLF
jgi:hypothetical protein